jgi:hypothetical protein
MSPGLTEQSQENGTLLIVAEEAAARAFRRVFQDHVELKALLASRGIKRILCVNNIDEAESVAQKESVKLALAQASLRPDPRIVSGGMALLKRLRMIHGVRFPVIVFSFHKEMPAQEPIFEYPKDLNLKTGQYFLALPFLLPELQLMIEKAEPLDSYQLETVVYDYCSIPDFVRSKSNSIQHDLQHLNLSGDEKGERHKYFNQLKTHVQELSNALREKCPEELKELEKELSKLLQLGSRLSPSEVNCASVVFGRTLASVESAVRGKP